MGFNHHMPKAMLEHLRNNGGDLDHVDVTELITKLQAPWDGIEAPATFFARGDRIEKQLVKTGQSANPPLRLSFALAATEATGEYENTLREWHAKGTRKTTFPNFRVYLQSEFSRKTKHHKTSAQSVGRGIVNSTNDTMNQVDEAAAAAFAIAEVANAMQTHQNKQFKQMLEVMETLMHNNSTHQALSQPALPSNPGGANETAGGRRNKKKHCPHCKWMVYHKPEKCFELEANAAKHPTGWKSVKES